MRWMHSLKSQTLFQAFIEHNIDGSCLVLLTEEHMTR